MNRNVPEAIARHFGTRANQQARPLPPEGGGGGGIHPRILKGLRAAQAQFAASGVVGAMPSAELAMPRPSRIFRPAGVTPAAAMAANTTANPTGVLWPQSCWTVGLTFGTIEGTVAALAAMSVRIQVEGVLDLFTDGQAGTFAHAGSLTATNGICAAAFYPFIRWADQGTSWTVTVKNEAPGGGATLTPVVQFLIVDPRDLEDAADAGG